MSEGFIRDIVLGILALLGTVSTAASVVLASRFGALKRDVATVKNEVKNDHKTNLREENDERHHENGTKLDQIIDLLAWLANGWVDNRADISDLQEQTGQPNTRRSRRLAAQKPPTIHYSDIPGGTT